jgi:hypothetical protein
MVYVCGVCGIAIGEVLKKNWSNMVMVMMTLGKKYFFISSGIKLEHKG